MLRKTRPSSEAKRPGLDHGEPVSALIAKVCKRASDLNSTALRTSALTPRQFDLLLKLLEHDGLSLSALSRQTGIDRATLQDMLARLARRRLVRDRAGVDGRTRTIHATGAARDAIIALMPKIREAEARLLEPLSSEQREEFLAALNAIANTEKR